MTRAYRMTARADAAAETARRIIDAASDQFLVRDYDEVTLQAVAEAAGVSLPTVLRRFASKDQLVNAVVEVRLPEILGSRKVAHPGDIGEAVATLTASYESIGELNWRMLRQAHRFPVLAQMLDRARESHRTWIQQAFAPFLPPRGRARERRILLLFAATDFYQWKLLRIDLGRGRSEVEQLMVETVTALTGGKSR